MHLRVLFGFGLFSSFVSAIPLSEGNVVHARGLKLWPSDNEAANPQAVSQPSHPNQELGHSRSVSFVVTFTSESGARLEGSHPVIDIEGAAKEGVKSFLDVARGTMGVFASERHTIEFANSYPRRVIAPVHFSVTVQPSSTVCDPECTGKILRPGDRVRGVGGEIRKPGGQVIFHLTPEPMISPLDSTSTMHLGILFGVGLVSSFVSAIPLSDGNVVHAGRVPRFITDFATLRPPQNQGPFALTVTFTSESGARLGASPPFSDGAKVRVQRLLDRAIESEHHMGVPAHERLRYTTEFTNSYPSSLPRDGIRFKVTFSPPTTVCNPQCTGTASPPTRPNRGNAQGVIHDSNGRVAFTLPVSVVCFLGSGQ
ncbi:hypothetical protein D9757_001055 [Collybiopsis confluens]|uniref:Uncharacterized protein n=1 Tax=Collybiopsis confluens TaxID=2823264 RepID=A0A8H5I099_9AGAR|nr:hypothetical protein D9757_001055 [Collybiopsis confluens]